MTPLTKGRTTVKASINPPLAIRGRATVTLSTNQPSALAGGAFRLLMCRLKRAAPAVARGRCPQKNKLTGNLLLVRPSIVRPLKFNFLQAAPAGISWCSSLERPSWLFLSPRPLMPEAALRGVWIPRPLMPSVALRGVR